MEPTGDPTPGEPTQPVAPTDPTPTGGRPGQEAAGSAPADPSAPDPGTGPGEPPPGDGEPPTPGRSPWAWAAVVVLALVAIGLAAYLLFFRSDDEDTVATGTTPSSETTTTTSTTTSTTEPTTGTTPTSVPVDTSAAVFPTAGSTQRFATPTAAATAFATDFVGFTDPVVGPFQQGDSRSGEVSVQPGDTGPVTTVFVRQLDDSWWVLGAATANITLTTPQTGAVITSPQALAGEALAFEGTVNVQLRADGADQPIAKTIVTGGGTEKLPFQGSLDFSAPSADSGALVLLTYSAKDGSVEEAGVIRVHFR